MEEIKEVEVNIPQWAQGRHIDEVEFCHVFLMHFPMVYVDGEFYGKAGHLPESRVRKLIFDYLSCFIHTGLAKKVTGILEALKMECHRDTLNLSETQIHCANGTYSLNQDQFSTNKTYCRCRLPVDFNRDAPEPKLWLAFLEELLETEDILTLQEYMGYCLLPVNYAQKMLLIIGNGGEGKSRIGVVLHALMGSAMCNGSLAKVENNRFARYDLQNKLLMIDDDLRLEALQNTNYIKSIITAEQPLDLEKKGCQSVQGEMSCRFMAFGNGNLRSLHDRSNGFFRRQIILSTKPRRDDRVDDPFLAVKIKNDELEGILQWMIRGLERLLLNDLNFTISQQTRKNMEAAISDGNNVLDFMGSTGYFTYDEQDCITSRLLCTLYRDWCRDNSHTPLPDRTVLSYLKQHAHRYKLRASSNIPIGNGRMARGFYGMRSCPRF